MNIAACCAYFNESLIDKIVEDLVRWDVDVHLWALEQVRPSLTRYTRGIGPSGRSAALNSMLQHAGNAELILVIDDDVELGERFVPQFLTIARAIGADVAQPSLTHDSYHSYPITLQRLGCWARLTTFVEMGPVVLMTRDFLDMVGPFPSDSPMGWGADVAWAQFSREHGLRQAIVDACPVRHAFRPVASRYDNKHETAVMYARMAKTGVNWGPLTVLREYPMVRDHLADYLQLFPAPHEAVQHASDTRAEQALRLLWAVASILRPETVVELGRGRGELTRTLAGATARWQGKVVRVGVGDSNELCRDVACECIASSADDLFPNWTTCLKMIVIDADPFNCQQTRRLLDTWVTQRIEGGGVAVLRGVSPGVPETQVSIAVREWLREQPPGWRWQEFADSDLGLMWRIEDFPDFEGLLRSALPPPSTDATGGANSDAPFSARD